MLFALIIDDVLGIREGLVAIADAIKYYADRQFPKPPLRPGTFGENRLVAERKVDEMFVHDREVELPPLALGHDVVERLFDVTDNDVPQPQQVLAADATKAAYTVTAQATVTLTLIDKDDAGNLSAPRTVTFVSTDTLPPNAPGPFGADVLIAEREIPDA